MKPTEAEMAMSFIETMKVNIDNDKLKDNEFRQFVRNTLGLFPDKKKQSIPVDSLQQYITNNHTHLVESLAAPLERLENMRFQTVYDSGLWINSKNHITIIYTDVGDLLRESTFQVAAHGELARKFTEKAFKGKYSDERLSFEELCKVLDIIDTYASERD